MLTRYGVVLRLKEAGRWIYEEISGEEAGEMCKMGMKVMGCKRDGQSDGGLKG